MRKAGGQLAPRPNADGGIYKKSLEDFWDEQGRRRVEFFRPYRKLYEWDLPYARWFLGGLINVCFNCVDRHVDDGDGGKVALQWEGEPEGDRRALTYAEVQQEVVKLANGLKSLGVRKGTHVGIYMGMVPELPIAMLACARIGAPHAVVSATASADSISERLGDMACSILVTQDEAWRGAERIPLKRTADRAMAVYPGIKSCVVLRRTGGAVAMTQGRDLWWQHVTAGMEADPRSCPCEPMEAEDLLFVLYTGDGGGRPRGVMQATAGYLVGTSATHHYVFDVNPETVYWCTADIGSMTGHSYGVYAPLCNGITSVIYEGGIDHSHPGRWWSIVERHGITVLYAPSGDVETQAGWGFEHQRSRDLSSLRVLGTVGGPISPEAWDWYGDEVGGGNCPIVETWWQPETGMILISPLAGVATAKPGSSGRPFPGVEAAVCDSRGRPVATGSAGHLVIKTPYPSMLRGLYREPERYRNAYWERFPGVYFTGDRARVDADGDFWLLGPVDD